MALGTTDQLALTIVSLASRDWVLSADICRVLSANISHVCHSPGRCVDVVGSVLFWIMSDIPEQAACMAWLLCVL